MSPRLRSARAEFQAAYLRLLEAIEEEDSARQSQAKAIVVDELARIKARRALERHGLRKVVAKR